MPYSAAGLNQTLNIVALSSESEYQVGDRATVTIHILSAGVHADASTIDVILNHLRPMQRFVPVEQVTAGVYESSFEILSADVLALAVRVSVRASVGGLQDYRIFYLYIDRYTEIEVTTSTARASPGDVIGVTVRAREYGLARDVANLVVVARVLTIGSMEGGTEELLVSHAEPGVYRATYVVPQRIAQDTVVSFVAWDAQDYRTSREVVVFVDVPTKLLVWHHEVTVGQHGGTLEVLVANETGWPEDSAHVELHYGYFDSLLYFWARNASGWTDERGVASFDLSYPGSQSTVGFWGAVSTGWAKQGFSGSLVPPWLKPDRPIEIRRENPLDVFAPGEIASLHYTFVDRNVPVSHEPVYYYARTGEELVAHGVVQSDSTGRFTLNFPLPLGSSTIEFAAKARGVWIYDRDVVLSASRLEMELGEVYIGSMTRLSALLPEDGEEWIALIRFFPYRYAQGLFTTPWVLGSGSLAAYEAVVVTDATLEHTMVVPRFLPKEEDYLLLVHAFPNRPIVTDSDLHVYVRTIRIENLPPTAVVQPPTSVLTTESPVEIDAAASFDQDGVVAAYQIDWGDGSITGWTADPSATHFYRRAGEYTVTIRVQDDDGAISEVAYSVLVQATTFGMPTPIVLSAIGATTITAAAASLLLWRRLRRPPTPPA